MQVATLFREALMGAGMEPSEGNGSGYQENCTFKSEPQDDSYEAPGGSDVDLSYQYHNQNYHHNHNHQLQNMDLIPKVESHYFQDRMVKYQMPEYPYSFLYEDQMASPVQYPPVNMQESPTNVPPVKVVKERRKHDRFNGIPEEEVSKRTLPDHLAENLDIVIIGINPGLFAAYKGHHYAGPGNHFWKCLYLSGLTPELMTADDDYKLLNVGIGFTNMVGRPTKGSADLTRKEIKEGSQILLEKLQKFKPKIAVFNGKLIYEIFSGKKDFSFGRQPERVDGTNTYMWVMPSSSARCAQLPRAADKVPFYAALKKFRDYLNGSLPELDDTELVFLNSKLKNFVEPKMKDGKEVRRPYNKKAKVVSDEPPPPKRKRGRPKKIKVEEDL